MQIEETVRNLFRGIAGFADKPYDKILITYTDAGKGTIATVKYYNNNVLVLTLTLAQDTLTDTWTKS